MKYLKFIFIFFLCFCSEITFAKQISLREKIGQMLLIGFQGKTIDANSPIVKAIVEENIGGVILFDYNAYQDNFDMNIDNPKQVKLLTQQLQQATTTANLIYHRDNLPLLISVDYEGGKVDRLKAKYGFPATVSAKMIAQMPVEEAEKMAETMANTLKTSGFNLNFAPLTDVDVNPNNPIIGKLDRSFSAIPEEVASYAEMFSKHYLNKNIQCSYKHFPGHGSSTADSHLGFVDVTDTWHEQELRPYQQLLSTPTHCGMIMTAHIVNRKLDPSGLPATLSHQMLTGILRHEMNFDGVIITDDMQMKAIADNYKLADAVAMAINAGADMMIFANQFPHSSFDPKKVVDIIEDKVALGEIGIERINEAYRHISSLKKALN